MAEYKGTKADASRVSKLQAERMRQLEDLERAKESLNASSSVAVGSISSKFAAQQHHADSRLKNVTIGLLTNEEFRRKQQSIELEEVKRLQEEIERQKQKQSMFVILFFFFSFLVLIVGFVALWICTERRGEERPKETSSLLILKKRKRPLIFENQLRLHQLHQLLHHPHLLCQSILLPRTLMAPKFKKIKTQRRNKRQEKKQESC